MHKFINESLLQCKINSSLPPVLRGSAAANYGTTELLIKLKLTTGDSLGYVTNPKMKVRNSSVGWCFSGNAKSLSLQSDKMVSFQS